MTENPNEVLQCNAAGRAIILKRESCELSAYLDPGGIPTIGWGHTGPDVHLGLMWTKEQCDFQFSIDLAVRAVAPVKRRVTYPLNSNQFSALCSLCFNIGEGNFASSTVLRCVNAGNFPAVQQAMLLWCKDHKGNMLGGLIERRKEEAALFNAPAEIIA